MKRQREVAGDEHEKDLQAQIDELKAEMRSLQAEPIDHGSRAAGTC